MLILVWVILSLLNTIRAQPLAILFLSNMQRERITKAFTLSTVLKARLK